MWSEQLWEVLTAGQTAPFSQPGIPEAFKIPETAENYTSPHCLSCCLSLARLFLPVFQIRSRGFSSRSELKTPTNAFSPLPGRVTFLAMTCCQLQRSRDTCRPWAMGWDIFLCTPWNPFSSQGTWHPPRNHSHCSLILLLWYTLHGTGMSQGTTHSLVNPVFLVYI